MADFLDSEAEESEQEDEFERKSAKKNKALSDSEEDEEDDEERLREELKDLIDDNPIEEDDSAGDESDGSGDHTKRKKSDDEDELDDRLEDEDYDLIEENLGVKVERKRFKRLKKITDEGSDDDEQIDNGFSREVIAEQLFECSADEEEDYPLIENRDVLLTTTDNQDEEEDEESDADDFIVDDDGVPISDKRKKKKHIFTDASLQEGQDIFGVDFDYDEFEKYDDDDYEYESEVDDDCEEDGEQVVDERPRQPKKQTRKKSLKKTIFDIFEPSELKRGHFTDLDNEIRKTDIPERMQLRDVPITPLPEGSNELEEEAQWIYKQAFCKSPVSNQETCTRKTVSAVPKIKQALDFMRNQHLEVPFIAFYRKEYVQPDLNINDLWKVYKYDAKWCQMTARKNSLLKLFENMRRYQLDLLMATPDATIPDDTRIITDDDIDRLKSAQSQEELKDVHNHFLLYYSHAIPSMHKKMKYAEHNRIQQEKIEAKKKALEEADEYIEGCDLSNSDIDRENFVEENVKLNIDSGPYAMCRKGGLCGFAKRFGLTPEQFAENVRDSYQRHEVQQEPSNPTEVAEEYINHRFTTVEDVLHAAKFMVARQIAKEPLLRKCLRELYYERAKVSVRPTKKGLKEVDENHQCYSMKYLKDKPVRDLTGDQYLKLQIAQDDKLLTVTISEQIDGSSIDFMDEMKTFYYKDEFSKNVQEWNKLRAECVELALKKMVFPELRRELQCILLQESKESVMKTCCRKLYNWIKIAPFNPALYTEWPNTLYDTIPANTSFLSNSTSILIFYSAQAAEQRRNR
ncbi:transcription elongation factor SPT6 isoform X1 [Topomyia yanbarensis]|uniref:transcription elongation factor SPT6 isoform X1 n=1 Tax=Topomyia yanbarensis TaxID=2498891 RepID=UPI00273B7037|nr:transcription elongation factor SPT6 isoform X1 [Topomyia yanbarensis]XP_058833948.1 transcription elongation factor SPT6 isoform X1 [Topomyia yanbarensis]